MRKGLRVVYEGMVSSRTGESRWPERPVEGTAVTGYINVSCKSLDGNYRGFCVWINCQLIQKGVHKNKRKVTVVNCESCKRFDARVWPSRITKIQLNGQAHIFVVWSIM